MKRMLLIHINKETQKYDRFEIYPVNADFPEEKIRSCVEVWNGQVENNTTIKIYDDELLCDFAEDVRMSTRKDYVISSIKSILSDIEYHIDSLESWQESIEDILKEDEQWKECQ